MKKILIALLALCMLFALTACAVDNNPGDSSSAPPLSSNTDPEGPIGDDWHVWGMYEFFTVGDVKIATEKVYNDDNQITGYNIYADGKTRGELLGEIRCTDADCLPEDFDPAATLSFEDYNADGITDIGTPLRTGEVMWYVAGADEYGTVTFSFAEKGLPSFDAFADWHDWDNFKFYKFDDEMSVAIAKTGEDGKEVGFNVFADLGPERGALLGSLRFADGGYILEDFNLDDCIVLDDYDGNKRGDIGLKTKNGDILWYVQSSAKRFTYKATQKAE